MTIGNCEEVTVLEAAEVGHRDPSILVLLVGVGRRLTRLRREGELSDAIGEHLSRIRRIIGVFLLLGLGARSCILALI